MLNWWLIVLIIIIPLLCIGLAVYCVFYFQHPDDDRNTIVPKIVFGTGLVLAVGSVLLVPYDAANSPDPTVANRYNNTLNTELMWKIVLWIMTVFVLIICPFFLFFTEAYDPDDNRLIRQIVHGMVYTVVILVIFFIITGICYGKVGYAAVPYVKYTTSIQFSLANDVALAYTGSGSQQLFSMRVTFTTYMIGMLCFFGWIFFLFYGGAGLMAYPLQLIYGFVHRPKAIGAVRFNQEMSIILAKADALLDLSLKAQREARSHLTKTIRTHVNILSKEVYFLEAQQKQLIWAYTLAGGSPFVVYGKLLLGIVCVGTSIIWCIHIVVYNTFHANPLLNTLLIRLDNAFAFFGLIAYGVLAFYLVWATFQGQMTLGLRILFFQIHPMKKHDTLINAFLFNVWLLLITSFAILQFIARSFQSYAPLTAINGLMNVYVLNLRGIGAIIRWIQYGFLGVSVLTVIWIVVSAKLSKKRYDPTKIRLDDMP